MMPMKLMSRAPVSVSPSERPSLSIVEEAYRLAVCLVTDERLATRIAAEALYHGHVRSAQPEYRRLLVFSRVLHSTRRVLRRARGSSYLAMFPELRTLSPMQQLTVLLEAACSLSISESAQVLQLSVERVSDLRRTARHALSAALQAQRVDLGNLG